MTPGKIIDRLLGFGPPLIARHTTVHARCVLATAVGIDTLRAFGLDARPLPVHVRLWNAAAWDLTQEANFDPVRWHELGAFMMGTDLEHADILHPVTGRYMVGHLVMHMPARQVLLDLDLQSMSRPQRRIVLPQAAAFNWPHGTTEWTYGARDDARLRYTVMENRTWEAASDWRGPGRARLAAKLARAIRKGQW